MSNVNKVFLMGRLTRDPEFKTVGGTSLVNFDLAVGEVYVKDGEKKEKTNFIQCEAWGKTADIIQQYIKKGVLIHIEGRLKYEQWETSEGKKSSRLKVITERLNMLPKGQAGGSSEGSSEPPPASSASYNDDDIPF